MKKKGLLDSKSPNKHITFEGDLLRHENEPTPRATTLKDLQFLANRHPKRFVLIEVEDQSAKSNPDTVETNQVERPVESEDIVDTPVSQSSVVTLDDFKESFEGDFSKAKEAVNKKLSEQGKDKYEGRGSWRAFFEILN